MVLRKSTGSSQEALLSQEPEAIIIPIADILGTHSPKTALKKHIVVLGSISSINI